MTNTKAAPVLTETIAVRVSEDECRALAAIARSADRTISWVIRLQLREFLRNQPRSV
jgi:hypothetical protein